MPVTSSVMQARVPTRNQLTRLPTVSRVVARAQQQPRIALIKVRPWNTKLQLQPYRMATVIQQRLRGRPARRFISLNFLSGVNIQGKIDPQGPTFLTYTPDGKRLITAGSNSSIRIYTTGSDGEPTNLDDCQDNNLAVVAAVGTAGPMID